MSTEQVTEAKEKLDTAAAMSTVLRRDNEEYTLIKKLPKRFPSRPNDIYITNRTNFNAQYEKCQSILQKANTSNKNEVYLHAMGPAINRAINLSLRLQENCNCTVECYTADILLEDDLMPLLDHLQISQQHRHISSVHIKIYFK